MKTPHLARIAYVSALQDYPSRAEIEVLMSGWRRRNAERGITGLLLYDTGSVFQLIEGFPEDVVRLYDKIVADPRHHFLARLIHHSACERAFGDWSMGLGRVTAGDLAVVPELAAFRDPEFRYWHCNEQMAEALVTAFTAGPWRRSIA